jgi:hypothetical protein
MRTINKIHVVIGLVLIGLMLIGSPALARPIGPGPSPSGHPNPGSDQALSPQPSTIDMITQNKANIATTISNFGYLGGYQAYDYPSGEWPRNSGHDYIGEIRYWMGAVTESGDTLVANTYDDFQGMAMPTNGESAYKIYLSTDTTRYYEYDPSDTVGAGIGSPARGWRVWDPASRAYTYNGLYEDPLQTSPVDGGPTSLQDSHFRFNDAASGQPLLGLELTHTCLSWNYCYNEDFVFVVMEITNTSDQDYTDFAVGLYMDIDVGGPDGTGENGRLGDLVAFDSTENLAWIYDQDSFDPGWGPRVKTGVMGTKYLETPQGIGMTGFRSDDWAIVSNLTDADRYELIASEQFDPGLPPTDQFYIQCTRGINLKADSTVRIVYALIAGENEDDFRENASLAQGLYDANFIGPQPPATPVLSARSADGRVYLSWTDTSETFVDPATGEQDFVGYKLYRSDDRGRTWGVVNEDTDNDCLETDYHPIAWYAISETSSRVPHTYVDTGLYNGVEYWYCLAAYDGGDTTMGIDALQSGFGIAGQSANVVAVTPESDPAGFYDAAGTVTHEYTGYGEASAGTVTPIVFDESELTGSEYAVTFADKPEDTYWYLLNTTDGDTLLSDMTFYSSDPNMFDIVEGLRVSVTNAERYPEAMGQSQFATSGDTTLAIDIFWGPAMPALTGSQSDIWNDSPFRDDFELRYTGDSTKASWLPEYWYGGNRVYWVPFEAWNTVTNTRISLAVWDYANDGVWDPEDDIAFVNYPYDTSVNLVEVAFPTEYSWLITLDTSVYNPSIGDVLEVQGAPMNGPADRFTFKVDGINAGAAAAELQDIKVVPNPYYARYSPLVETAEGESVIKFINLPDECTIRVYTLAGDLVETIRHRGTRGEAEWDLLSMNRQQVASGMYLYHVESPYGERLGRFAVIK